MRFLPVALAATATVLLTTQASTALMIAFSPPYMRALTAEAVVVGKVSSIEKEEVEIEAGPGVPKQTYRVALVRINSTLNGADGLTHIKVGFIPAPTAPQPDRINGRPLPIRRAMGLPELKPGDELLFFLDKHPNAGFHVMNFTNPPINITTDDGKKEMAVVKKVLDITKSPKTALTAAKAEDRYFAACTLLINYRRSSRGAVKEEPIPAEESALILKGLLEGDWNGPAQPNGTMVVGLLGLNPQSGFTFPKLKPGQKPGDQFKKAFATWLEGPGKGFVIKRFVVKTK